MGYFLGIKHTVEHHGDGHISAHLSQEAFIDALLLQHLLHHDHVSMEWSPYKSWLPVDKIQNATYTQRKQEYLTQKYQSIVGSLNWLATSTRLNIAPITNILAKHSSNLSEGHLAHAKHVLQYLKGTKSLGITFSSRDNDDLQSFVYQYTNRKNNYHPCSGLPRQRGLHETRNPLRGRLRSCWRPVRLRIGLSPLRFSCKTMAISTKSVSFGECLLTVRKEMGSRFNSQTHWPHLQYVDPSKCYFTQQW